MKTKYKIINFTSDTNYWYLDFDVWNWTNSDFTLSADSLQQSIRYQTFEGMHIFSGPWNSRAYFSPLDVNEYLDEYDANENGYNFENSWFYNETDLSNYFIIYTFDRSSGVLSKVEIKDNYATIIYRFTLQTNSNDQIPFTNIFLIVSLFTFANIVVIARKKMKIISS
jgi:hypothetical protein